MDVPHDLGSMEKLEIFMLSYRRVVGREVLIYLLHC
jgi:hypothetical protein